MQHSSKIYVAGHQGLVGSALMRLLSTQGYTNLISRSCAELDLRNQQAVQQFFAQQRPEYVFLAAAKVGGIKANDVYQADFLYDNLMIQTNVVHAAWQYGVKKLLFLGSSCIYPRLVAQPIKEDTLLTGRLEKTNESYAIAKISGIKLCQAYAKQYGCNFMSAMPTNLYGPHDTFDQELSHVIPALILKISQAHTAGAPFCTLWGTGSALREFLYVEDCAQALVFLMQNYHSSELINVGYGKDISIENLARIISRIVGYEGTILFDNAYPDGTPQKLLDSSLLHSLGWKPTVNLEDGIKATFAWYQRNQKKSDLSLCNEQDSLS